MTAAPVGFDFPAMSALSVRPPHAVPADELPLELDEELARRCALYPALVDKGRLTEEQSRRHIAILAQIRDEFAPPAPEDYGPAWDAWCRDDDRRRERRLASPFAWEDKIRELRRELDIRRSFYPGQIAKRRLDAPEARLRLERMDALHWSYWIAARSWDDTLEGLTVPECRRRARDFVLERAAWELDALDAGDRAVQQRWRPDQVEASRVDVARWRAGRETERGAGPAAGQRAEAA